MDEVIYICVHKGCVFKFVNMQVRMRKTIALEPKHWFLHQGGIAQPFLNLYLNLIFKKVILSLKSPRLRCSHEWEHLINFGGSSRFNIYFLR